MRTFIMESNPVNDLPEGRAIYKTDKIGIDGMTCDQCVKTVEKALKKIDGVTEVEVSRDQAVAFVTYDIAKTNIPAIHDALLRSGYRPAAIVAS